MKFHIAAGSSKYTIGNRDSVMLVMAPEQSQRATSDVNLSITSIAISAVMQIEHAGKRSIIVIKVTLNGI